MNKIKIFAMAAVAMMMVSGAVVLMDSDSSDAAEGVLESLYPYSWTWDEDTGMGPFNSFYAAFDINNGNAFVSILNPYDLSKKIDGTSLGSGYNIMWVIPTVYWSADENGNLTVSNDSTKGIAYAHTIDGNVYNYIAIGVYEATGDAETPTKLTSETGKMPVVSQTRAQFRTLAHNYTMDSSLGTNAYSMQWNFYQWELYKYLSLIVMEDFNSQAIVGNGHTYGGTFAFQTGATDSLGPYAGKIGEISANGDSSVKLFIENAWGGVNDFVDGVVVNGIQGFYVDTNHTPTDASAAGTNVVYYAQALDSSGFPTTISTSSELWGFGTDASGNASVGLADYIYTSTDSNRTLSVGGQSFVTDVKAMYYGVSYVNASSFAASTSERDGSRLAFVFDADPAAIPTTQYTYTLNYDPSLMATTSKAISVAGMDPISHVEPPVTVPIQPNDSTYGTVSPVSVTAQAGTVITTTGNTLTIDTTTITATPAAATAQYTYAFNGWYVADVQIESGVTTINTNTTITARFAATVNTYTVTIQPSDPSLGSVDVSTIPDVPYGSTITVSGNTLTIGSTTVTATPNEGYETKWSVRNGATISGDMTITATFQEPSSPTENLLNLVPFFIVIAIVMAAIAGIRMSGSDPMAIVKLVIGLAVVVIIFATLVLPILGQV